jgi:Arc/MetJ-type ribon-helix-helix transcriptional regulator
MDSVVRELLTLLREQKQKAEPFEKRLAEINAKIEHIEATIQMYTETRNIEGIGPEQELVAEIRGLTHKAALRKIAEANGGRVTSAEAKRLFVAAGLAKGDPKNLGPHVWSLLNGSPDFEHEGPGVFRLLKFPQPALLRLNG